MSLADEASTYLRAIDDILSVAREELETNQQKLVTSRKKVEIIGEESIQAVKAFEELEASLTEKAKAAHEEYEKLSGELTRLKQDVQATVARKSELQLANARLEQENAKLIAYEKKAWTALNAKDASLVERETALEQRENLRPIKKSVLPPTE